jgi:hypothetical protein
MWCLLIFFCYGFPLKGIPCSHWNRRTRSHWVNKTAGFDTAVSMTTLNLLLRFNWDCEIFFNPPHSLIEITRTDPAISLKPWKPRSDWDHGIWTFNRLSNLSWRIRSHMQNGFSPWIRALGGIVQWKKNRGRKISWQCSFNKRIGILIFTTHRYDVS